MKVCVDIQSALAQRAGVGRYTKELVQHLGPLAAPDELLLFYFDFKRQGLSFRTPDAQQKDITCCPGRLAQKAWKSWGWPPFNWWSGRADVFHFPNFIIPPLTHGRPVVTIHDVSFLRFPEATEAKNLRYLTEQIRQTVSRAHRIITDSDFSAREISETLSVDPSLITAIPLGLTHKEHPPDEAAKRRVRAALDLTRPYLLFVGTLEPRKNIPFLIELFERMDAWDGDLVIAGMKGWKYEPIIARMESSSHRARIRYLEYVDEAWLDSLYAAAELFVFPSLYEGFGFPPLEAMKAGTPVLSSTAGSLPEVLGSAAAYVDTFDAEAWAQRAQRILADAPLRERMRAEGLQHVTRYHWEYTARRTWQVYREVGA